MDEVGGGRGVGIGVGGGGGGLGVGEAGMAKGEESDEGVGRREPIAGLGVDVGFIDGLDRWRERARLDIG
ncbi:hypothetical protein NL676_018021 [Syzygium grande]|nr:hypothetical protein NL676_018021 [Syzygium grande]